MATTPFTTNSHGFADQAAAQKLELAGYAVLRYGLVAILLFFGAFKFTAVEAAGIQPLVANSPLMSWLYALLSTQGVSNLIGVTELVTAALIAVRMQSPFASAIGSLAAIIVFLTTLTFLVSTPGIWQAVPGFPLPVPNETGSFLLKDVFLLGAALVTAAEAMRASARA